VIERHKNYILFKIPITIAFFQYIIKFFVAIFVILFPLIVVGFLTLFFWSIIHSYSGIVLFITGIIFVINWLLLVKDPFEPELKTKWFRNLQTYFLRRWIMKNIACLECGKQLDKTKSASNKSSFIFQYFYICSSCGKKYKPKMDKNKKWKFEL